MEPSRELLDFEMCLLSLASRGAVTPAVMKNNFAVWKLHFGARLICNGNIPAVHGTDPEM